MRNNGLPSNWQINCTLCIAPSKQGSKRNVEAKAEVKAQWDDRSGERAGWPRSAASFLVALIVTLVFGFTPDVNGLVTWFLARSPFAGAHLLSGR